MPASHKPRKKYRVGAAVQRAQAVRVGKLPVSERATSVRVRMHESLARIMKGGGTHEDWEAIAAALNVAVVLSETVFDNAYRSELILASVGHARCGARLHKSGSLGYSGEELKTLNMALDVHDAQLDTITNAEFSRAVSEVMRRRKQQPTLTPANIEESLEKYIARNAPDLIGV